jgi:hypothetical protein
MDGVVVEKGLGYCQLFDSVKTLVAPLFHYLGTYLTPSIAQIARLPPALQTRSRRRLEELCHMLAEACYSDIIRDYDSGAHVLTEANTAAIVGTIAKMLHEYISPLLPPLPVVPSPPPSPKSGQGSISPAVVASPSAGERRRILAPRRAMSRGEPSARTPPPGSPNMTGSTLPELPPAKEEPPLAMGKAEEPPPVQREGLKPAPPAEPMGGRRRPSLVSEGRK